MKCKVCMSNVFLSVINLNILYDRDLDYLCMFVKYYEIRSFMLQQPDDIIGVWMLRLDPGVLSFFA